MKWPAGYIDDTRPKYAPQYAKKRSRHLNARCGRRYLDKRLIWHDEWVVADAGAVQLAYLFSPSSAPRGFATARCQLSWVRPLLAATGQFLHDDRILIRQSRQEAEMPMITLSRLVAPMVGKRLCIISASYHSVTHTETGIDTRLARWAADSRCF